jgi:hypothetical protein
METHRRDFNQVRRALRDPGRTQCRQNQTHDDCKSPIETFHALLPVHSRGEFPHEIVGRQAFLLHGEEPTDYLVIHIRHMVVAP